MATTPLPPKFGALKLVWLKMLKISVRNWSLKRSVRDMFLKSEKSSLGKPCPATRVTPPRAAAPVKGTHPGTEVGSGTPPAPSTQGCVKAAGLPNQFSTPFESVCTPSFRGCPVKSAPQPRFDAVPLGQPRAMGWPPWSVVLHTTFHPPIALSAKPEAPAMKRF